MKCNLIVAGFAKCGTSSLHEYLDMHPQVCMSKYKEPHFFSKKEIWNHGKEWHDMLFENTEEDTTVFGESSTSYAVWEPALVRIKQELDDPKIILILREPISRLLSHYRWMYALGHERLSLGAAIKREQSAVVSPEVSCEGCYPWYRRTSNYSYFVPLAEMIFGKDRVLIIKTQELAEDPQGVLNRCFRFLDLDDFNLESVEVRSNRTEDKTVKRGGALRGVCTNLPVTVKSMLRPVVRTMDSLFGDKKLVALEPSMEELRELECLLEDDIKYYKSIDDEE